jgi:Caspase domain/Sel1 repeat
MVMRQAGKILISVAVGALVGACVDQSGVRSDAPGDMLGRAVAADDLLIVDCLLPGQVRKLGSQMTYLTARRPIRTTAQDCEIRGGEYVAYDRANYATALQVWLPRAQEGDADAQNKVGEIYERGMGTHPDYEQAALWYKRAAEQGFSRAEINLGFLYEKGLGVPKDLQTALNWYRKGSKLPDAVVIDHGELAATRAELSSVKQELQSSRQQLDALREELASSRSQLDRARHSLGVKERQLQQQRQQLRRELERQPQGAVSPQEQARIAGMRVQVERQQRELERSQTHIRDLESQSKAQREKLLTLEAEGISLKDQLALAQEQARHTRQELEHYQDLTSSASEQLNRTREELAALRSSRLGKANTATAQVQELERRLAQRERALAQQQDSAKQLQAQAEELQRALEAVSGSDRAALRAAQGRLAATTKELERSRSMVAEREQELAQAQSALSGQEASQGAGSARIKALETQLKERETALKENQKMVEQLRSESLQWKDKLAQLEQKAQTGQATPSAARTSGGAAGVPIAPPTIQLIDPPIVAVRGAVRIPIKRGLDHRSVVGQVEAPAGLFSLTINGARAKVDAKGLFETDVLIAGAETPLSIVAVDRQGERAALAATLVTDTASGKTVARRGNPLAGVNIGGFYALVIGNQKYEYLPSLDTAAKDAEDVAQVLRDHFGFKVQLMLNGTRFQILEALNHYRQKLTDKDNLVIYYAGHGELDRVNLRGNWLPVDAEPNSTANWISNVSITDILNAMSVRHVLIVADSCYSGALTRSSLANLDAGESAERRTFWLKSVATMRSRTALTSGGLAPVLDGGGGAHSVFAKAFLNVLKEVNDVEDGQRIYREVAARVAFAANRYEVEQVPQYAPIKFAGHESGDFLFVPKSVLTSG